MTWVYHNSIHHSVSLHRAQSHFLPIPKATSISSLLLPIITGVSLLSGQVLAGRSLKPIFDAQNPVSWTTITVFVILTIYETVIATLSVTYASPPSSLTCLLDTQWQRFYSSKNENAIKTSTSLFPFRTALVPVCAARASRHISVAPLSIKL